MQLYMRIRVCPCVAIRELVQLLKECEAPPKEKNDTDMDSTASARCFSPLAFSSSLLSTPDAITVLKSEDAHRCIIYKKFEDEYHITYDSLLKFASEIVGVTPWYLHLAVHELEELLLAIERVLGS